MNIRRRNNIAIDTLIFLKCVTRLLIAMAQDNNIIGTIYKDNLPPNGIFLKPDKNNCRNNKNNR